MIFGKMFEGEGDNKKSKEKRLFCCPLSKYLCTFAKTKNPGSSPASNNLGEGLTGTALQRYAFLLKDARNYWKIFKAEEDKKKKVYPRLPDVWGKKDTPYYIIVFPFPDQSTEC